jgi:hypothetical protein
VCVCVCVTIYIYIYIYIYYSDLIVCVCVCVCDNIYIHTYIHIYIYIRCGACAPTRSLWICKRYSELIGGLNAGTKVREKELVDFKILFKFSSRLSICTRV